MSRISPEKGLQHIEKSFTPEFKLLLSAVAGDADIRSKLSLKTLDWDRFIQLTLYHRIYPVVHSIISRLEQPALPEAVRETLRQHVQANHRRSLALTGAAIQVVAALEQNGMTVVVLKGSPLSGRLYGDLGMRPFNDLDLLVWPGELERAGQILEGLGYRRTHPDPNVTPLQLRAYLRRAHHFNYVHPQLQTEIELHWQLRHKSLILLLPPAGSLQRINAAGFTLPVLPDEEWFLFLILHGAGHGWTTLRWLCDIAEFMRLPLDWEKISTMAEDCDIRPFLNQGLILANQLLGASIPEVLKTGLTGDAQARRLARLVIRGYQMAPGGLWGNRFAARWHFYWWKQNYDLQAQIGWQAKLRHIKDLVGPSEADVQRLPLPDCLYPVYYAIRPFTWLGRRLRHLWRGNDGL